ncbi:hypothetical protein LRP30_32790 [Bradyrhizobium sp. C-145]|uniref:hypothetical protein n=1 Tax=Bradyrhizobium sp. C-145 TaxID=574727 RepID=UPI00201B5201|nr:hypothetical protein [Bradyrhizobium sp. C-145]UQR61569.1 hypothetical protein LRP30_32790 [Bradyrhizobium sp. C-145]
MALSKQDLGHSSSWWMNFGGSSAMVHVDELASLLLRWCEWLRGSAAEVSLLMPPLKEAAGII